MTPIEAVERLLEALPEFGPEYEESDGRPREPGDELLLHVVNAVWVIEWFAWGDDDDEKAALIEAGPLHCPTTKSIRAYYLLPDQTKVAPARLPPDDESSSRRQDSNV
jgi:hypothetical protein